MSGDAWMQMLVPPLVVMAGVSCAYFFTDHQPTYGQRLLASAHGATGVVLLVIAYLVALVQPQGYRPYLAIPYLLLYLVPVALIVVALVKYRGSWVIHLLQVPNVIALLWSYFVGGMAITGDWL